MTDQHIFYLERIKLLSGCRHSALEGNLDLQSLEGNCDKIKITALPYEAQSLGYKSMLDVIDPNDAFLRYLSDNVFKFETDMRWDRAHTPKVNYVGITRDTIRDSKGIATREFQEIIKTMKMKWARRQKASDTARNGRAFEEWHMHNPGIIGEKVYYYGSKMFEYAIYPRISRVKNLPCVHEEWGITGSKNVLNRTGISSIRDLETFELEPCFNELYNRFMIHEIIDEVKLGKWLMGSSGQSNFNSEERKQIKLQAGLFLRDNRIDSAADLTNYFEQEKRKLKGKRGRKSNWEKMVLAVSTKDLIYT